MSNSGSGGDRSVFQVRRPREKVALGSRALQAHLSLNDEVRKYVKYLLDHLDEIGSSDNRTVQVLRNLESSRIRICQEYLDGIGK